MSVTRLNIFIASADETFQNSFVRSLLICLPHNFTTFLIELRRAFIRIILILLLIFKSNFCFWLTSSCRLNLVWFRTICFLILQLISMRRQINFKFFLHWIVPAFFLNNRKHWLNKQPFFITAFWWHCHKFYDNGLKIFCGGLLFRQVRILNFFNYLTDVSTKLICKVK